MCLLVPDDKENVTTCICLFLYGNWFMILTMFTKSNWLNETYRWTASIELWHLAWSNHRQCYRVLLCVFC